METNLFFAVHYKGKPVGRLPFPIVSSCPRLEGFPKDTNQLMIYDLGSVNWVIRMQQGDIRAMDNDELYRQMTVSFMANQILHELSAGDLGVGMLISSEIDRQKNLQTFRGIGMSPRITEDQIILSMKHLQRCFMDD